MLANTRSSLIKRRRNGGRTIEIGVFAIGKREILPFLGGGSGKWDSPDELEKKPRNKLVEKSK